MKTTLNIKEKNILDTGVSKEIDRLARNTKGNLISKCPFGVIVWTKIPRKFFPGFLP